MVTRARSYLHKSTLLFKARRASFLTCPLSLSIIEVVLLGNTQTNLVFRSLIRNFAAANDKCLYGEQLSVHKYAA